MWALTVPSPKDSHPLSKQQGLWAGLQQHGEVEVPLSPCQGQGRGGRDPDVVGRQSEIQGWIAWGCSWGGEMDQPELGEQGHTQECQVVGDEADAVGLSRLEALRWHRHKGEHQAQPQRPGQHPHQGAVRLQLWGDRSDVG